MEREEEDDEEEKKKNAGMRWRILGEQGGENKKRKILRIGEGDEQNEKGKKKLLEWSVNKKKEKVKRRRN